MQEIPATAIALEGHAQQMFDQSPDPLALNRLALAIGQQLIAAREAHAAHEAGRKPLHLMLRDQLIGAPGPDGKPFSRSAAHEEALVAPEFLTHVEQADALQRSIERLQLLYELVKQRAWIATEMLVVEAERLRIARETGR